MGPPFYVVIRATRRSSCWQGKCSTLISQLFFRPWVLVRPKDQTRDLALCSQALCQLFELVLPAVYCSSDQNTSPQAFLKKRSALIRVKFLSFGVSWERYLYGDLIVTSSWLLSLIPNLRLRQCDLRSVLWRSWRNFQILSTHRCCVPNVVLGPFVMACVFIADYSR